MKRITQVPLDEVENAKKFAEINIIEHLKNNKNISYSFSINFVGSASKQMVVFDEKGHFDLDFQIKLDYQNGKLLKANKIREIFKQTFVDIGYPQTENSTTALTVRFKKQPFSFDFVIIGENNAGEYIIRRNINPNNNDTNHYHWDMLTTKFNDCYDYYDKLGEQTQDFLKQLVIEAKMQNYKLGYDKRKSGSVIFIEKIYEYKKQH